ELTPVLETPDDLHDLLSSTLLLRARPEWESLWNELVTRHRGVQLQVSGTQVWTTTECRTDAEAALAGEHAAVVRAIRGHLELSGVTSVAALASTTLLPADEVVVALAALEREGFALQGHYRAHATGTEWVARRLLARMHGYSKQVRRQGFEAVTARDFMR